MAILKTHTLEHDVPVDINNVEQFIQQYAPEVVQGYFLALADFKKQVRELLYTDMGNDRFRPYSNAVITRKMKDYHNQQSGLLERFESLGLMTPQRTDDAKL